MILRDKSGGAADTRARRDNPCTFLRIPLSRLLPPKVDLRLRDGPEYLDFFNNTLRPDVRERGIQQAIVAYKEGVWGQEALGLARVVEGESRRQAGLVEGLYDAPCMLYESEPDAEDLDLGQLQFNECRLEMTALEKARAYDRLQRKYGWSQGELARRVKKKQPWISKCLAVVTQLPEDVQGMIGDEGEEGKLCFTGAAVLARLGTHERMRAVAQQALGMGRDGAEFLVARELGKDKPKAKAKAKRVKGRTAKGLSFEAPPGLTLDEVIAEAEGIAKAARAAKANGMTLAALPLFVGKAEPKAAAREGA